MKQKEQKNTGKQTVKKAKDWIGAQCEGMEICLKKKKKKKKQQESISAGVGSNLRETG